MRPVLENLQSKEVRILRHIPGTSGHEDSARFEILHDVLAPAVLNWCQRHAAIQNARVRARVLSRKLNSSASSCKIIYASSPSAGWQ